MKVVAQARKKKLETEERKYPTTKYPADISVCFTKRPGVVKIFPSTPGAGKIVLHATHEKRVPTTRTCMLTHLSVG